ncbi:MAG: MarR family transcriptional regulator, partial [Polyangiales bacterium]
LEGLSAAQLFVLQQLAARPTPASLGHLARATHTDPSSVSTVVQRLFYRRLVLRRRARDDARRAEISLSARGRRVLASVPGPTAQERIVSALMQLPEETREGLVVGLRALIATMGVAPEPGPFFFEDGVEPKRAPRSRRR